MRHQISNVAATVNNNGKQSVNIPILNLLTRYNDTSLRAPKICRKITVCDCCVMCINMHRYEIETQVKHNLGITFLHRQVL